MTAYFNSTGSETMNAIAEVEINQYVSFDRLYYISELMKLITSMYEASILKYFSERG